MSKEQLQPARAVDRSNFPGGDLVMETRSFANRRDKRRKQRDAAKASRKKNRR